MRILGAVFILISFFGCGYHFQGAGSVLPPDVRNIYIPMVENQTTEPGLTVNVTESLRDRFGRYGVVSVVDNLNKADAVLEAKILSIDRNTKSVTAADTALEYDVVMTLAGQLVRTDGSVLWRSSGVKAVKSIGTTSDIVVTSSADFAGGGIGSGDLGNLSTREISRSQEQEALLELADIAAGKIYDSAVVPEF